MKRRLTLLSVILFFLLFALIFFIYTPFSQANKIQNNFSSYLDQLFAEWVSADTITLHYQLADPSEFGILKESISMTNSYLKNTSDYKKELASLHTYPVEDLSPSQQKIYAILEDYFEREKALSDFPLYQTIFSPTTGIQAQLPVTLCEFPIRSEDDLNIYFDLLKKVPSYFKELYELEKEKAKQGLFCNDRILQQILDQMDSFLKNRNENPLITSFPSRIQSFSIDSNKKQQYISENKTLVLQTVLPSYKRLRKQLYSLKGSGKNNLGLYYYDRGKEYYEALTAYLTGSDLSPGQMIDRTEQNIQSLYRELEEILYLYPNAYASFLKTDLSDYIPNSETSVLSWLQHSLPPVFPKTSKTDYEVKYVPDCLEDYVSPAFYMLPAIDDFEQNTIYINQKQLPSLESSYSVLAHEGYPGHLYQTTYFYEHMEHPVLSLCNYNGYVEGWAVYAENLSYSFLNLGTYSDKISRLYQINHILNLAIPARIDLGVHYEGWNLQKIRNYLSNLGLEKKELNENIMDTVLSEPGNYLSYYIGYLEIDSIQSEYTKQTKNIEKTNDFYQVFLSCGPCDFEFLRKTLNIDS